jgi:inorganic pyrophosphatase
VPRDLLTIPARDESGAVHIVVECPQGSRVKLKYAPDLQAFVVSRPLVLGVTYPYDWGFVPGTRASDGDPVDAMVLFDAPTYPGVLIACRPIAVLEIEQNAQKGGRERNDRILAVPAAAKRATDPLSSRMRDELAAFFVAATQLEGKDIRVLGWGDASAADALIDRASR